MPGHPTGAQLRAARGLLNLSVLQLSEITGLALNTIKRAEGTNDFAPITAANAMALVAAYEARGVSFVAADETLGAGARLRLDAAEPFARRRLPTQE